MQLIYDVKYYLVVQNLSLIDGCQSSDTAHNRVQRWTQDTITLTQSFTIL
jgi:hypothetical protein